MSEACEQARSRESTPPTMSSSDPDQPGPVTRALADPGRTPSEVLDEVLPHVYRELRQIAENTLRSRGSDSVQPTDLLHEAYVRLSSERRGWDDRANLMVAASVAMRRALVDHVRRKRAVKRDHQRVEIDVAGDVAKTHRAFDVLDVEDALLKLEEVDSPAAEVAEMRLFGGYSCAECGEALGVTKRTAERRWRFARAWLVTIMSDAAVEEAP